LRGKNNNFKLSHDPSLTYVMVINDIIGNSKRNVAVNMDEGKTMQVLLLLNIHSEYLTFKKNPKYVIL